MKKIFLFLSIVLLSSTMLQAQNVKTGGKETITLKGFISATWFLQNQDFKFTNGQAAEWANPPEATANRWFGGMDVRNTRLTTIFNGPEMGKDWKLGGVIEFDYFGGFNGSGAFSAQQLTPRLRLAYVDIHHNNLTIRVGQAWSPLFGNVPVSVSHIAFPLGYGSAGFVGWRFPGVYLYYKMGGKDAAVKTRLDFAMFTNSWSGPGNNVNFFTAGNSGLPQFEFRLNLAGKIWSAYAVGHYDKKDFAGYNVDAPDSTLSGTAFELGAKVKSSGFLLQGNFYYGKNIGQQFGHITQIQGSTLDLSSTGFWVQAGYDFTKSFGLYAFYGIDTPDKDQALALFSSPRTKHNLMNFMLKYTKGQFSMGIEYLISKLTTSSAGASDVETNGNQVSYSVLYKF